MITDIPTDGDFRRAGLGYIHLAVDQVMALYYQLNNSGIPEEWEEWSEFWEAAQQPLASALALVQQGVEFLVKSRIAAVSPFLLLSGDWVRQASRDNTRFSTFYTLRAEDLLRAHDIVHDEALSAQFRTAFEDLRNRRNTIMHTVDPSLSVAAEDMVRLALFAVDELVGGRQWVATRRDYLENTPASAAYTSDHVDSTVIAEAMWLIEVLPRSEAEKYLGFNARRRHYWCPTCEVEDQWDQYTRATATLEPNTPSSTNVHCFICEQNHGVVRVNCTNSPCRGNVIFAEDNYCLTCRELQ